MAVAGIPVAAVVLFGAVEPEHPLPTEAAALLFGAWAVVTRARYFCALRYRRCSSSRCPGGVPALLAPGLRRFGVTAARTISVDAMATGLALVRWFAYAAFLIAALEMLRRPGAAAAAALTVVAVLGLGEALYGVWNLLAGNEYILWAPRQTSAAEATGTFVNRNHYAVVSDLCHLAAWWMGRGGVTTAPVSHGRSAGCPSSNWT